MTPTSSREVLLLAGALRYNVGRMSRRLRKRALLDLTPSQLSVLMSLERHGEQLVGELTRREQVNKSTMTRIIAKLEDAGYLARAVDSNDRRGFLVSLTEAGRDVLGDASGMQDAYLTRQIEALDAAEQEILRAAVPVMEKLLDARS